MNSCSTKTMRSGRALGPRSLTVGISAGPDTLAGTESFRHVLAAACVLSSHS